MFQTNNLSMSNTGTLLENGRARGGCGALMRYRESYKDFKCTMCPHTVKLSDLTPMRPKTPVAPGSDAQ